MWHKSAYPVLREEHNLSNGNPLVLHNCSYAGIFKGKKKEEEDDDCSRLFQTVLSL